MTRPGRPIPCAMMVRYHKISQRVYQEPKHFDVDKAKVQTIIDHSRKMGITVLGLEALPVLEAYGIPTLKYKIASSVDDALKAAQEMGYPGSDEDRLAGHHPQVGRRRRQGRPRQRRGAGERL